MNIRIESDGIGAGTKVFAVDGTPIQGISAIDLSIRPNDANKALLTFCLASVGASAEALISEEHLKELAAVRGYHLVKV